MTATIEVRIADVEPFARFLADLRDVCDDLRRLEFSYGNALDRSEGMDAAAADMANAYLEARRMVEAAIVRFTGPGGHRPASDQADPDGEPF